MATTQGRTAPRHANDAVPACLDQNPAPVRGAFRLREASLYLGLEPASEWLLDADCPVPKCDIRKPGAGRPIWVWRREALDDFLASREVPPGAVNPQGL
jgi:hypothetical protein